MAHDAWQREINMKKQKRRSTEKLDIRRQRTKHVAQPLEDRVGDMRFAEMSISPAHSTARDHGPCIVTATDCALCALGWNGPNVTCPSRSAGARSLSL